MWFLWVFYGVICIVFSLFFVAAFKIFVFTSVLFELLFHFCVDLLLLLLLLLLCCFFQLFFMLLLLLLVCCCPYKFAIHCINIFVNAIFNNSHLIFIINFVIKIPLVEGNRRIYLKLFMQLFYILFFLFFY